MGLHRLIYLSYAHPGLGYGDLRQIMDKSEINNAHAGVTGMLCLGNSIFLQILEGNRRSVNQIYHRIAKDDRHHSPEIIDFRTIDRRNFTEWSMKLVQLDDSSSPDVKKLIYRFSDRQNFAPENMSSEQCYEFMKELYILLNVG